MITDNQTNFLYLADTLPSKYTDFFQRFEALLNIHKIAHQLLPLTKDIWAVDYMPIQRDINDFVQFIYDPKYLKTKSGEKSKSNPDTICRAIGISTTPSKIKLDGGNIVHWKNRIIMTDRIFEENPEYSQNQLLDNIIKELEINDIVLIPEQPGDFTGHADGLIRFIDEKTVVINDLSQEKKQFKNAFEIAIHNAGFEAIVLPYNPYNNKNNTDGKGCYINYLQMKDIIIFPIYGMKEDDEAFKQIQSIYPGYTIATINCKDIAKEGGVLNCISWNIQVDYSTN